MRPSDVRQRRNVEFLQFQGKSVEKCFENIYILCSIRSLYIMQGSTIQYNLLTHS